MPALRAQCQLDIPSENAISCTRGCLNLPLRFVASFTALFLALLPQAPAQGVPGQVSGTVADQRGAVIAGATVKLIHDLSQHVRTFATDADGNFLFTNLVPGSYSVHIEHPGFKQYDQKSIVVT